jgi:hypothetical protein
MKLLSKKQTHILSILSVSAVMIGMFQNCAQSGSLQLTTEMEVESQKMSNTFYVLKNSPEVGLKPVMTNKEANHLMTKPVNSKMSDEQNPEEVDPNVVPVANGVVPDEEVKVPEVFEITLPKSFPMPTEHGHVLSIDPLTGVFTYEPQTDYVGEDKVTFDKIVKMEVTAETKDAVKSGDGKYYLVSHTPVQIKIIIHNHQTPKSASNVNQMGVSSAEENEIPMLDPIERDKNSPDKPLSFEDGKFPDQITKTPKANWTHSSDNETGINFYEMAVGRKPGTADVVKWTNIGFVNSATLDGKFTPDEIYFTSIRAVDFAGLRSEVASGDGWQATEMTNESLMAEITAPIYSANPQIEYKIKFNHPVDKFAASSFSLSNITGAPVVSGTGRNYLITAMNNGNGNSELKISKGAVADILGNRTMADFTSTIIKPRNPASLVLGTVPNSLSLSPTINWAADPTASDKGWASYTVNLYSANVKIKSQTSFTKGSTLSSLTLTSGTIYSVKVQGIDMSGFAGPESTAATWTASAKATVTLVSGSGSGMNVTGTGATSYSNWVEFQFSNDGGIPSATMSAALSNPTNFEIWSNNNTSPQSVPYSGCNGLALAAGSKCSVFVRAKATEAGTLAASNLTVSCSTGCPSAIPLNGTSSGFIFTTTAEGGNNVVIDESWLRAKGWNGGWSVVINNNGNFGSNSASPSEPALKINVSLPAGKTLTFNNCSSCSIIGKGGAGGAGGMAGNSGSDGGLGLMVNSKIILANNGVIAGGGGGGGGGGGWHGAGGGGGGGAGSNSNGGAGGTGLHSYQGGFGDDGIAGTAGSLISAGSGGNGGNASILRGGQSTGATNGGSGSGPNAGGGGSPGTISNTGMAGGGGGGGGGLGSAGGSGGVNTFRYSGSGRGGQGGPCTSGNSNITWSATGTRYGTLN